MSDYILETPRLGMRRFCEADIPHLRAFLQRDAVMFAYGGAFDEEKVQQWYRRQLDRYDTYGDFGSWALCLKESGIFIGQCGLTICQVRGADHMEVGYILDQPFWGHGYATEGAIACKEFAFRQLSRSHVVSRIRCDNMPSINVAIRNGMTAWDCVPDNMGSGLYNLVFGIENPNNQKEGR